MSDKPIWIATRASRLALWQANHVADLLRQHDPNREVTIVPVSTLGDRDRSGPLSQLGGEGLFTREIQKSIFDDQADFAVHSLKDLPTDPVEGLTLAAVPPRASMYDALVLPAKVEVDSESTQTDLIDRLPANARIGTGSLRRRAQLLHYRNDLQMIDVRGNVETRIAKLDEGEYDALVLAEAGLQRLGLTDRISAVLEPLLMLPAVGQGALGIECRSDDENVLSALAEITDAATHAAVRAERRLLSAMRAGCQAPLGVFTHRDQDRLTLEAVVLSQDGQERLYAAADGPADDPDGLGEQVAKDLIGQGADRLVAEAKAE